MLLEKLRKNKDRIKAAGRIAVEQAKAAGVPSYYRDPKLGDRLIREMPDGSRMAIEIVDGEDRDIENVEPRLR